MEDDIRLICGDCLEKLKELKDNSVDLVVTDPPYGYSFMKKNWDKAVMGVEYWKGCLRVLKPGAFAFVMSAPRQDVLSRIIANLANAGFEMGFTSIYHTYAAGFPKASNIGKMVDKRLGNKREIVGRGKRHDSKSFGKDIYGKYKGGVPLETKGASPIEGSYGGFQPKPAVEIILVCMKPLNEKTYVDQALKNKKGITWLDNCRVPYESDYDQKHQDDIQKGQPNANKGKFFGGKGQSLSSGNLQGRFPANLLVSDDVLNDGRITKSGQNNVRRKHGKFVEHDLGGIGMRQVSHPDIGSYSRYFDLDKWAEKTLPFLIVPKAAKREKNRGMERLPERKMEFESTTRTNKETADKFGCERKSKMQNNHPTVKPVKLMSYLITLGSRPGDMVLDPFMGSGTTGIACKTLNRRFVGIELSREYFDIAKARIAFVQKNLL